MKDTTFWPNEEQLDPAGQVVPAQRRQDGPGRNRRSASSNIRSTTANRQPMPAGGLFSTAADVARFCQMVLNGGEFDGKRYLSEAAVKQMTSKQTGDLDNGYGLGWSHRRRHLRPRRRLCHQHDHRHQARPDHRLDGPARRLPGQRRPGPGRLPAGGREAVRRRQKMTRPDRAATGLAGALRDCPNFAVLRSKMGLSPFPPWRRERRSIAFAWDGLPHTNPTCQRGTQDDAPSPNVPRPLRTESPRRRNKTRPRAKIAEPAESTQLICPPPPGR